MSTELPTSEELAPMAAMLDNLYEESKKKIGDRNHKQFHTFLKIQHGLMQRLKSMSDMYKEAEAGQAPRQQPEVAFLQGYLGAKRSESLTFARAALGAIVTARNELRQWD